MHTTYKYRHMYTSPSVCMCPNDMNAEMRLEDGKILMGYWKTKGKQNWVNMVKIHDISKNQLYKTQWYTQYMHNNNKFKFLKSQFKAQFDQ